LRGRPPGVEGDPRAGEQDAPGSPGGSPAGDGEAGLPAGPTRPRREPREALTFDARRVPGLGLESRYLRGDRVYPLGEEARRRDRRGLVHEVAGPEYLGHDRGGGGEPAREGSMPPEVVAREREPLDGPAPARG